MSTNRQWASNSPDAKRSTSQSWSLGDNQHSIPKHNIPMSEETKHLIEIAVGMIGTLGGVRIFDYLRSSRKENRDANRVDFQSVVKVLKGEIERLQDIEIQLRKRVADLEQTVLELTERIAKMEE